MRRPVAAFFVALILGVAGSVSAQEAPATVTYPTADGGTIHAELYGAGSHAVLLAHGRIFNKESWEPLARRLEAAGYQVLAIDFRGYGDSTAGGDGNVLEQDILGGIRDQHAQAPDPKKLVLLPGAAHAQHIFKTDQAERLTEEILAFLESRGAGAVGTGLATSRVPLLVPAAIRVDS